MLLPSRTATLEGVAAVRGQLQGRKLAASLLNPSSSKARSRKLFPTARSLSRTSSGACSVCAVLRALPPFFKVAGPAAELCKRHHRLS